MWLKRTRTCPMCRVESSELYIRAASGGVGGGKVTRKHIPRPPPVTGERFDFSMSDDHRGTLDFLLHISALAHEMYAAREEGNQVPDTNTQPYTPLTRTLMTPGQTYSFGIPRSRRRAVITLPSASASPGVLAENSPDRLVLLYCAPESPSGSAPQSN